MYKKGGAKNKGGQVVIVDSAEELQQKQQQQVIPQPIVQPPSQMPPQIIQNKIMSPLASFAPSGYTPNHPRNSSKSPRINHINKKTPEHRNGSGGSASGTPTHSSTNNGKVPVIGGGSSRTPNRTPSRSTPTRTPTPTALAATSTALSATKHTPSPIRQQKTSSVSPHLNLQNATVASTAPPTVTLLAQEPRLLIQIPLTALSTECIENVVRKKDSSRRSLTNRTPPITALDERLMATNVTLIKTAGGNTTPRENVRLPAGLVNDNSPRLANKVDTVTSRISSPHLVKPIKVETNANSTTYMFEYADYNAESFDNFKKLANNNNTVKQEQFIKNEVKKTPPLTGMSPPDGKEGEDRGRRKRSLSGSRSPYKEKKRKKDKGGGSAGNNGFEVSFFIRASW